MQLLQRINISAAVLHLGMAVLSIVWWIVLMDSTNKSTIQTDLVGIEPEIVQGVTVKLNIVQYVAHHDLMLITLLVVFFCVTGCFHIMYAAKNDFYEGMIAREQQWLRWVEYAISASIMILIIGFSMGCKILSEMICMTVLTILIMACGFLVEYTLANRQSSDKSIPILVTCMAWLMFLSVWYILGQAFFSAVLRDSAEVPGFVYLIFIVMLVLYSLFGFVQAFYVGGKFKTYRQMEITYISLSFVSKASLGFLLLGGLINRSIPQE